MSDFVAVPGRVIMIGAEADLANLPNGLPFGTIAILAGESKRWQLGLDGQWTQMASGGSIDPSVLDGKADKTDTVLNTYLACGVSESSEGTGQGSIAFGENVDAPGNAAVAFNSGRAVGDYSAAIGYYVQANAMGSFATGAGGIADGKFAHADGMSTTAVGDYAHSEGFQTGAYGEASHAEGYGTLADAMYMHAEGVVNRPIYSYYPDWVKNTSYAVGDKVNYHNGGYECIVANNDSYFKSANWQYIGPGVGCAYPKWVSGNSYAKDDCVTNTIEYYGQTYTRGYKCTVANDDSEFDFAKWQTLPSNGPVAFVIGNQDTYNANHYGGSNAFRVDWDGNAYLNGDLRIGCEPDSSGGKSLASLFEMIAPTEGTTSAHAYAQGDVFISGDKLYKATSAIAVSDTITPGTNCAQTTLAALIKGE